MHVMHQAMADEAICTLQHLIEQGRIGFPQPWTNRHGHTVISWDPDTDGDVLACYLDMLGLNGREPKETREGRLEYEAWLKSQQAARLKRHGEPVNL